MPKIIICTENGIIYFYNIENNQIENELQISKNSILNIKYTSQNILYGITASGEIFICTFYRNNSLSVFFSYKSI